MHEVLISYSKDDKRWADAACSVLEARGIRCWIAPRDILPGTEWGAAIISGIDACKVMVLIFSASANASPQVRREVERAISKGLTVVPCRVEDVTPVGAMEYALSNTHWLDVFTPPVERQMNRLAESVQALLLGGRGATNADDGPLVSDSSVRKESRRESSISGGNRRGKYGLLAGAGFTLFILLAVGLAVVFWPRKDAASPVQTTAAAKDNTPVQPAPVQSPPIERQALAPAETSNAGFKPLFDGTDLAGWRRHPNWRVESGILIGSGRKSSFLFTERGDFTDFEIQVEARINDGGNSGVHFRAQASRATFPPGYEAQINSTHRDAKTGSLYVVPGGIAVLVAVSPVPPGEWFKMNVLARGREIVVKVNGVETARYLDDRFAQGHIALEQHDPHTVAEFRKIEIKELTPH